MGLPATFDGKGFDPGYRGIEAQVFMAADKANGKLQDPTGVWWPRLTWGQMLALVQAWKRAAARSTVRWSGWYDLSKWALGWEKEGDRFIMTKQWAQTSADPASLNMFWTDTGKLAADLDASGAKIAPLYVDWTWDGYERAARDTWSQMKIEREADPRAPAPVKAPGTSESSGWGGAVILIALLLAAGISAKKRK